MRLATPDAPWCLVLNETVQLENCFLLEPENLPMTEYNSGFLIWDPGRLWFAQVLTPMGPRAKTRTINQLRATS